MSGRLSRRDLLKRATLLGGAGLTRAVVTQDLAAVVQNVSPPLTIAGRPVQVAVTAATPLTTAYFRILPIVDGRLQSIPSDGALDQQVLSAPEPLCGIGARGFRSRRGSRRQHLEAAAQRFASSTRTVAPCSSCASIPTPARSPSPWAMAPSWASARAARSSTAAARRPHAQRPGRLSAADARRARARSSGWSAPGWAMFIHQPLGAFDLTGDGRQFRPPPTRAVALPLDVFVVGVAATRRDHGASTRASPASRRCRRSGRFGYQQSHRTLAGRDEMLQEAKTFREKKLPCDALIYLGTGVLPVGLEHATTASSPGTRRTFPIRRR